jgi:hypothetical protein
MSGNDDFPKTAEEALARGYKPIRDLDRYIREKLGISQAELEFRRNEFAFSLSIGVNCADPSNLNKVCRRDDGLGIICTCGVNKQCNCLGQY